MSDSIFPDIGLGGLGDLATTLFGSSQSGKSSGSKTINTTTGEKGVARQRTRVDRATIDKTIQDILSGNEGLADILNEEQGAGIFDSTVAQEAIQELVAKVAGEIGKITGETVQEFDTTGTVSGTETSKSKSKSSSGGLLSSLF